MTKNPHTIKHVTECGHCPCLWTDPACNSPAWCQLGNFELKREDNELLEFDPQKCPIRKGTDVILTKEPEDVDLPWG